MRRLTPRDYRTMPWRNGGGSTTELLIEPADADAAGRFLYRVSIADVRSDGPFSRFDGYQRHIMLVEGAGMTIDCGSHGSIALSIPLEPHTFSGDWDVVGTLTAGPVRDFNLIVDAARARSSLRVETVRGALVLDGSPTDTCIVHVLEGALEAAAAGETLVASGSIELMARAGGAAPPRVAVARIALRENRGATS